MTPFEDDNQSTQFSLATWVALFKQAGHLVRPAAWLVAVMLLMGALDAILPLLYGIAIDRFVVPGTYDGYGWYVAAFAAMVVLQGVVVWGLIKLAGFLELALMHSFRERAFRQVQRLDIAYFDRTPAGWVLSRLTSDIQRLGETIAWGLVDIVWGFAMMLLIAVLMLIVDARLALLVLSVVPPLAIASYWFQRRILDAHREVRKTNSHVSAAFNEAIVGVATTKVLVREEANLAEFAGQTGHLRRASIRTAIYSSLYLPIVLVVGSVGTSIALVAGGVGLNDGAITLGTIVAFVGYTVQFFEPVREVARVLTELQAAQSAGERVAALIQTDPTIVDAGTSDQTSSVDQLDATAKSRPGGRQIEFRGVSFAYSSGEAVLTNFNLTIESGSSVALVGRTGAGKSTIVNLLTRFYEPVEGVVAIDGRDYRTYSLVWLRNQISYVLQEPVLFAGTVADNIRYGKLDATRDDIEVAAKTVAAHDVIKEFPDGYDHVVGESGGGLSTGQKQLISFARAVVADRPVLILDEATSSVDVATEQRIQHATTSLLRGRTSVIVAHRLSTVVRADRILVLDRGRVVEDGPHNALVARGGSYASLYHEQYAAPSVGR